MTLVYFYLLPRESEIVDFDLFVIRPTGQSNQENINVYGGVSQVKREHRLILEKVEEYVYESIFTTAAKRIRKERIWNIFSLDTESAHSREMLSELITTYYKRPIENLIPNTISLIRRARDLKLDLIKVIPSLLKQSQGFSLVYDCFCPEARENETFVPFLGFLRDKDVFVYMAITVDGILQEAAIVTRRILDSGDEVRVVMERFESLLKNEIEVTEMTFLPLEKPLSCDVEDEDDKRKKRPAWMCLFC